MSLYISYARAKHMTTLADREAGKASVRFCQSLEWKVLQEDQKLGMSFGWTPYTVSHTNSDLEDEKRFSRSAAGAES